MFRGNANNTNCSPRYLNANNRPSNTNVNYGLSAQGWHIQRRLSSVSDALERRIHETRRHMEDAGRHWRPVCQHLAQ